MPLVRWGGGRSIWPHAMGAFPSLPATPHTFIRPRIHPINESRCSWQDCLLQCCVCVWVNVGEGWNGIWLSAGESGSCAAHRVFVWTSVFVCTSALRLSKKTSLWNALTEAEAICTTIDCSVYIYTSHPVGEERQIEGRLADRGEDSLGGQKWLSRKKNKSPEWLWHRSCAM